MERLKTAEGWLEERNLWMGDLFNEKSLKVQETFSRSLSFVRDDIIIKNSLRLCASAVKNHLLKFIMHLR